MYSILPIPAAAPGPGTLAPAFTSLSPALLGCSLVQGTRPSHLELLGAAGRVP